jgi:Fic family protein
LNRYDPPYTITDSMLDRVAEISEKLGKISVSQGLEAKPHLRRNNRIKSIHSSLSIEANSLSLGQVRDVIGGKKVIGEQREIQEVKNAYAAYEQIGKFDPYSMDDLKALHGVMTRYVVEESGFFRTGEEGVFSGDKCVFMAPPAKLVTGLMEELFSWMNRAKGSVHPLILSAVFHYEFVFIHPFADGNGRMARLWHTAILSEWKPIFEYIPLESQIEKFQDEYYKAIAACHKEGRSDTFIEFMLRQIDNVLDELTEQMALADNQLPLLVKKLTDCMEYDIPYTAAELMQKLNLKSRNALRNNYLSPAMRLGLVTMTIPDKPNSRNQRYIRK